MSPRLAVSALALAFASFALVRPVSAMQGSGDAAAASTPASVIVFNQKLDDSGVKLTYVYVPEKSFAVIYGSGEKGRHSGEPLGTLAVESGDHRDLKIPLESQVKPGDALWVSLYRAKDGSTAFNSESHVSYWSDGNLPSANGFVVQ